ncbi:hypothetical protein ACOSQ4_026255 [Xanthoceras sorbifolium]
MEGKTEKETERGSWKRSESATLWRSKQERKEKAKKRTYVEQERKVEAIVSYYKIPLKQVLVIFDDLDLPFAKLRLPPKGGHGGHNGIFHSVAVFSVFLIMFPCSIQQSAIWVLNFDKPNNYSATSYHFKSNYF